MSIGTGTVVAVSRDAAHRFSKPTRDSVRLLAGLGVEGDAHLGVTVQHRSRVAQDPTQPNLRQVHLIHDELFAELRAAGYDIAPGDLGENVTTHGVDLLALPVGTRLRLGPDAVVEITGLRNPCRQIDRFRSGLLKHVVSRDGSGRIARKGGVMGVVLTTGDIRPGDPVRVCLPATPHRPLERV
ncbi:MOSC domain-containing protein [Actinacidiphila sp. ITFR-21]|uniref:MOSC domain-containing protein n=1 Tax=Actinacidiphila sp. ITFR-21 TaxID=3075199 RepID=UPI00288A4E66|nr:MOSC domain-containing protein [Streptomyces sp. ITFR-21]WNI19082.1 MOSC domain-containing protein [Streptomyces sp. ITFR-21]